MNANIYVISYNASNGHSYQIENHFRTLDNRYAIEDTVQIKYLENEPENERIDSFLETYVLVGVGLLIELGLITLEILGIIYHQQCDDFIRKTSVSKD